MFKKRNLFCKIPLETSLKVSQVAASASRLRRQDTDFKVLRPRPSCPPLLIAGYFKIPFLGGVVFFVFFPGFPFSDDPMTKLVVEFPQKAISVGP